MAEQPNAGVATRSNEVAVPVAGAVSAIFAAIIVTFGMFVMPLHIGYKVYAYMGVCIVTAFLFRFYQPFNKWFWKQQKSKSEPFNRVQGISLIFVLALMVYCGVFKFSQYWLDGGAEPFFHDIAVSYISGLAILMVFWLVSLLISPDQKFFFGVIHSFRMWAYGFIWMHLLILIMLVIFEGD